MPDNGRKSAGVNAEIARRSIDNRADTPCRAALSETDATRRARRIMPVPRAPPAPLAARSQGENSALLLCNQGIPRVRLGRSHKTQESTMAYQEMTLMAAQLRPLTVQTRQSPFAICARS